MKLIQYEDPLYILEIPLLISTAVKYHNNNNTSLDLSREKQNTINEHYPNYLKDYQTLLSKTNLVLEKFPRVVDIHKLLPLGVFTSLIFHLNTLNFDDVKLEDFTQAAVLVLLSHFTEDSIDIANDNFKLTKDILQDGTIDFNLFFQQFQNFDVEDALKFKVLEYFNDIEKIFKDYNKVYRELLEHYLVFYKQHRKTYTDNKSLSSMSDLNIDDFIDLESFKESSSEIFYFSYSLINYRGLSAKLAVVDDELSFGMQGVFFSLFNEIEKENHVSIEDVESQISALGDNKRIRIFELLLHEELYLKELADALSLSSSTVSHHMDILQSSGLVKMRAKGKKIYYSINPKEINSMLNFFQKVALSLEESK